jgi:tetratricopeptide (TPR) repeat protein
MITKGSPNGLPFSLTTSLKRQFGPPYRLTGTAHRKASSQKGTSKILCRTGRMMRGLLRLSSHKLLLGCAGAAALAAAIPAAAQGGYSPYNETAAAALARYVRTLASDPKDFDALIGAGRAALAMDDTQAAAGFFARADEINPRSPLPQAGMGGVSVANSEPQAALAYFKRAQQLGASAAVLGCDRGLAFDLLGRQADAQSDYRAGFNGPDADEARRRLALSLAISGDKNGALATLAPLMAQRDVAAGRTRAFVLALTGDSNGAMIAIDAAMPGSWARVAPFLQKLPGLRPAQKAAAVNLGIFPGDSGAPAYAYNTTSAAKYAASEPTFTGSVTTDRLAGIDDLLRQAPQAAAKPNWQPAQQPSWQATPRPTQIAYSAPVTRQQLQAPKAPQFPPRKVWLQLASGPNASAFSTQFEHIRSKDRELFNGITGYVAQGPDRARLVIGPFRSTGDADIFAEDLQTVQVSAFKWSNSPTDQIVPLGTE